jgi:hypothetical protein
MRTKLLMLGFAAGAVSGILLTIMLIGQKAVANRLPPQHDFAADKTGEWPDSLDAVIADPANHRVVFENEKVRILEVVGEPFANEPVHTHKWPSIMWVADANFTNAKLIYYHYGYDPIKKTCFLKDSTLEQGPPANRGFQIPSEGPHRVRSLSDKKLLAYRVEFKNGQ